MSILQKTYKIKDIEFSEEELIELFIELQAIYQDEKPITYPPLFEQSFPPT